MDRFEDARLHLDLAQLYLFSEDAEEREKWLRLILTESRRGDPVACRALGQLLLIGVVHVNNGDTEKVALKMPLTAADQGDLQARTQLNRYCEKRYDRDVASSLPQAAAAAGPLRDFDGEPIKIDRQGLFTPVDAKLTYEDGRNVLTLSADICFLISDELPDEPRFKQAVLQGMADWAGRYRVFGGQDLEVRVELTADENKFDCVYVIPCSTQVRQGLRKLSDHAIMTAEKRATTKDTLEHDRSFAGQGLRWSVRSRKTIVLLSKNDAFDDYDDIRDVAKHEFGHVLGLGDLYEETEAGLPGVRSGTFRELDGYRIEDRLYNLVMCDHHGPVSNNDIEMVVLAFRDNKGQLYQQQKMKGIISKALGKGN